MKKILWIVTLMILSSSVYARPNTCKDIYYDDERNYCLALSTNSVEYCSLISEPDRHHKCKAIVSENRAYCGMIRNHSERVLCRNIFNKND